MAGYGVKKSQHTVPELEVALMYRYVADSNMTCVMCLLLVEQHKVSNCPRFQIS